MNDLEKYYKTVRTIVRSLFADGLKTLVKIGF